MSRKASWQIVAIRSAGHGATQVGRRPHPQRYWSLPSTHNWLFISNDDPASWTSNQLHPFQHALIFTRLLVCYCHCIEPIEPDKLQHSGCFALRSHAVGKSTRFSRKGEEFRWQFYSILLIIGFQRRHSRHAMLIACFTSLLWFLQGCDPW